MPETQSAIEKQIGDLEVAVDRLRSLYEQYFMGIEKIQPMVPRKDVDRRIYAMRKEQIRNTALRFRFQMVLQRYNTYQTHWQRICREIENGTYKRHLAKAKQRFGGPTQAGAGASERPPKEARPQPGAAIASELEAELAELDREFESAEFQIDVEVDAPDDELEPTPLMPEVAPRGSGLPPWSGGGPPPQERRPPSDPPPGATALAPPFPPPTPQRPMTTIPRPGPPLPPPRPRAPSFAQAPPPARPPTAIPPPRPPTASPPSLVAKAPLVGAAAAPRAAAPTVSPARPTPAPPAAPVPKAVPTPAHSPVPRPVSPASPADLPEARMKQLYAQLVEAKRKQNESTAAVTYQAVAKSLQESGEKLRQKHGRAVDFEVAIKDGRAILRPVLK